MKKMITIFDVGAANFLPPHFPLNERFSYIHFEADKRGLEKLKVWLEHKGTRASHVFFNMAVGDAEKKSTSHLDQKNTASMIVKDNFDGPSI
jgi:hypothetical protein